MVRIKRRFIIFQIQSDTTYNPATEDLISGLQPSFSSMYGIFGCGHVWPVLKIMFWIPEKRIGAFRVPRDWSERFINFLESTTTFNNVELRFKVYHVSGTIDQAQRWLDENNNVIE